MIGLFIRKPQIIYISTEKKKIAWLIQSSFSVIPMSVMFLKQYILVKPLVESKTINPPSHTLIRTHSSHLDDRHDIYIL